MLLLLDPIVLMMQIVQIISVSSHLQVRSSVSLLTLGPIRDITCGLGRLGFEVAGHTLISGDQKLS